MAPPAAVPLPQKLRPTPMVALVPRPQPPVWPWVALAAVALAFLAAGAAALRQRRAAVVAAILPPTFKVRPDPGLIDAPRFAGGGDGDAVSAMVRHSAPVTRLSYPDEATA